MLPNWTGTEWLVFILLIALVASRLAYVLYLKSRRTNIRVILTLIIDNLKFKGEITMFSMHSNQRIKGSFLPVDDKGNSAKIEPGSVTLSSSNPDIFAINRDRDDPDNELAFEIVSLPDVDLSAGPKPGTVVIEFDGHSGDGVVEVSIPLNGEVTSRDAVGGNVTLGTAIDL